MLIDDLKKLIDEFDGLKTKLKFAKSHILRHIADFPPDELECLAKDGLIDYTDIPEDKRTTFVKGMIKPISIKQ